MRESMFYKKESNNRVECNLCPQNCKIANGKYGFCRGRKNENGKLYSENYGMITSLAMDPIEKKPLYHFYPGHYILSAGSYGCNLRCTFCQNWEISQQLIDGKYLEPEKFVDIAKNQPMNLGIAYTYNEPFIWYEYVYDTSKIAKRNNLKNVLVTNGFANHDPLKEILPYIDAINIDVKGFTNEYYHRICSGKLEDVIKTVELASKYCHVEVTTLLVTGENDNLEEIENLCKWLSTVNIDIPLHFSRYFPQYKLRNPPTPSETLKNARNIAKKYLHYVYIGNAKNFDNNTYCPKCGNLLIKRDNTINVVGIKKNKCSNCGYRFYGYAV